MKKSFKVLLMFAVMTVCFALLYETGYAAEAGMAAVTEPLNKLYTLFASVITVVGAIMCILAILSLASSWQFHDTTQQVVGIMRLTAGIMIAVAPWVVSYILDI